MGKSLVSEKLLHMYIKDQLVENIEYFSILKPIRDPVIFSSLTNATKTVKFTHSCNLRKPWCGKCAKCTYVWLNYCAYLPENLVLEIFNKNLFDNNEENNLWLWQLLGLKDHIPFECVGQAEEARLAFELCYYRGYSGKTMDNYIQAFPNRVPIGKIKHLFKVDNQNHLIPDSLKIKALPVLKLMAEQSQYFVFNRLKS